MTVRELIEALRQMPLDERAVLQCPFDQGNVITTGTAISVAVRPANSFAYRYHGPAVLVVAEYEEGDEG